MFKIQNDDNIESVRVVFRDQKKGENRIVVMQILLPEDIQKNFIGLSKGT